MNRKSSGAVEVASGVETLIHRLRDEGVADGRAKAANIINEAEETAARTIAQAEQEAQRIVSQARDDAERLQAAGRDALHDAARDALLGLRTQLAQRFTGEVKRLVGEEVEKKELLEKLILEIASRVKPEADEAEALEILLPQNVVGLDELTREPEELEHGKLTYFVRLIGREMLRQGVSFGVADDEHRGIRVQLKDEGVTLDLSDEAIAAVLLEHLQPRFRALLEGIVK